MIIRSINGRAFHRPATGPTVFPDVCSWYMSAMAVLIVATVVIERYTPPTFYHADLNDAANATEGDRTEAAGRP